MAEQKPQKIRCPNEKCPNKSRVYYRMRSQTFACGGCGSVFDRDGKILRQRSVMAKQS